MAARARAITFDECARQYIKSKSREFRNAKHIQQWSNTIALYASPVIGKLPVDHVELGHIVKILEPLWQDKTETATRVRGRIESVLAYATASGFRSGDNPARWKGNLDAVLPKPGKVKKVRHLSALPIAELPAFLAGLRARNGMGAKALEFAILTAARSGEIRGATWDEIDLEAKLWTIPGERMKAQKSHTVPLCSDALKLLKHLPRLEGSPYVFPSARGGQLSDVALTLPIRAMGSSVTVHGFRSTFRDWCSEFTNVPRDVAEMALAHTIPSAVERAYRRGDLLMKRTKLMSDWGKFINTPASPAKVVSIKRAKR